MIDNYTRLLKIQEFSEELIKLQERIAAIDNEILISEKNIELEKEKISKNISKKNDNLLKIKSINKKINCYKNEIIEYTYDKKTCVGYVRTSQGKNYDRQYHTIHNSNFHIVNIFCETISAHYIELNKRCLDECINYCFDNDIKYIVISEASRLSRNTKLFDDICSKLIDKCINVYSCSEHIYLFDDNFNLNFDFYNKIVDAEKEIDIIRNRLVQGYYAHKESGGSIGRHIGYKKPIKQYEEQYSMEMCLLRNGLSYAKISHITGTAINTIRKIKKMFNITTEKHNVNDVNQSADKTESKKVITISKQLF